MTSSTPTEQARLRETDHGHNCGASIRILTITLEREVAVTQRVTHTVVVPAGVSEEAIRDQVLHETHSEEWHDKAVVRATQPIIIGCREVPMVLGHMPGHWTVT